MTETTPPGKTREYPWFRCQNGIADSKKVRTVAKIAKTPMHVALSVWLTLLCEASGNDPRGYIPSDLSDEDIAYNLDLEPEMISPILSAMQGRLLNGNKVINWEKHNPKREREDDSKERVARHRAAKKDAQECNDVTPCNATVTPSDAKKRPTEQNSTVQDRLVSKSEPGSSTDRPTSFRPGMEEPTDPPRGTRRKANAVELVFDRYPWMREAGMNFCTHKGVAAHNRLRYLSHLVDVAAALDANPNEAPADYPSYLPWNDLWGPVPMGKGLRYDASGNLVQIQKAKPRLVTPWDN